MSINLLFTRSQDDSIAVSLFNYFQTFWVDANPIDEPKGSKGLQEAFGKGAYLMLLTLGLLAFNATKARRCMCGGLSLLGVLFLPCAAFLDLIFVWCAACFSFREFIHEERIIPEGMRNLHPAGGGPSKRELVWKYDGPHGTGEVRLFRLIESSEGEIWEAQQFISPAAAWVFYLDELQDEIIMNSDTCVKQLYWSLWIYSIGIWAGIFSMGIAMLAAWMSSSTLAVRIVGMHLAVLRASIILWRWTADLFMSNHHRGARLRQGTLPGGPSISCKVYRRSNGIDAFPKIELPGSFSIQTLGTKVKILFSTVILRMTSKTARLFQNWWLDWCAGHFDVYHPSGGPTVKLDVRVGDKSHIVTVPEYIADGLSAGTIQPRGLAWLSVAATVTYIGLMGAQLVLFFPKGISVISVSLWGGATVAGIVATAWLGGSPLVCSGIAGDVGKDFGSAKKSH